MDEETGYFQGEGLYRKTFRLSPNMQGKKIYLYFEGVNQQAEVQVNEQLTGKHLGGYTAFTFNISPLVHFNAQKNYENTISVKVDNRVSPDLPPLSGDFIFSGGIYRDVFLIVTDPLHFDLLDYASSGVYLETPGLTSEKGQVKVRGRILNEYKDRRRFDVLSQIKDDAGKVVGEARSSHSLRPQDSLSFEQLSSPVSNPKLWSPESPYQYLSRSFAVFLV